MANKNKANQTNNESTTFPPIVAVLGHVDHGKTSLLDTIRKSSIAEREFGGITQRIGASSVEVLHEGKKRFITFIDTPGHEAFSQMRSRGATAADVGLLIVSAVDGVMPQTKESITMLKESHIPYIAVLTKVDVDTAIPEKVKQQLAKEDVLVEGLGGDVPVIEVSAKTGLHIKELLDLILLVHDLHARSSVGGEALEAIIIESRLDQKAGPRATVIIKNGKLSVRETVSAEKEAFKVRTIMNSDGLQVKEAQVGDAVEILGFSQVPSVGSKITHTQGEVKKEDAAITTPLKRELVYASPKADSGLAIVLAADTQGSLEAIVHSLPKEVKVIAKKTGEVTEADILMAKSTGAIVLGFNSKIRPEVQRLAFTEKVLAKNYNIIYEMFSEVKDVLEGKRLAGIEQVFGTAQIIASFPFEKSLVLGVKVLEGRVARGDKARLERKGVAIGESSVSSLRSGKNPVSKVERGQGAGLLLNPTLDFQIGDMLLCHS